MKKEFKEKIIEYIENEISKDDLYNWVVAKLHKILKVNMFDLEYLEMSGIITEMLEINEIDDYHCKEYLKIILDILMGNICKSYTFAVKIPPKCVEKKLQHLKSIILKYLKTKKITQDEMIKLKLISEMKICNVNTLNDMLEVQIIDLLNLGYDFCVDDKYGIFNLKSTLYISDDNASSLEDNLLYKIIDLLNCYEGIECFWVHVYFNNGIGNISLQV